MVSVSAGLNAMPVFDQNASQSYCVPFARTSTRQKHAFAVVGPSIWNCLPLSIRSLPGTLSQTFLTELKTVLFVGVGSASD